ncbi:hypothetical protein Pmani_033268 [Petrolisthes manimaculis]|uniref:Pentraxin (PTX) domain-containing protein n=1 Tax=Petrolisthes manimaculis TaxID=1843537 RepID=A0AAE1TQU0_9EUCA|nr:hypothetical protein Pmani_033268 [Petrolisthes manimaculis]
MSLLLLIHTDSLAHLTLQPPPPSPTSDDDNNNDPLLQQQSTPSTTTNTRPPPPSPTSDDDNNNDPLLQQQSTPSPDTILVNLTVCSWLNVHHFREKTYVYSYATSDKDNNELNMSIREDKVFIAVGSKYLYGNSNTNFLPGVWYHVCFVVDHLDFLVYLDGSLHRTQSITERSILLNGTLILGQEADKVLGGFQEQQSFSGRITGFNLYSRALSSQEVTQLATCDPDLVEGDLVAWSRANWTVQGQVRELDLPSNDYCTQR